MITIPVAYRAEDVANELVRYLVYNPKADPSMGGVEVWLLHDGEWIPLNDRSFHDIPATDGDCVSFVAKDDIPSAKCGTDQCVCRRMETYGVSEETLAVEGRTVEWLVSDGVVAVREGGEMVGSPKDAGLKPGVLYTTYTAPALLRYAGQAAGGGEAPSAEDRTIRVRLVGSTECVSVPARGGTDNDRLSSTRFLRAMSVFYNAQVNYRVETDSMGEVFVADPVWVAVGSVVDRANVIVTGGRGGEGFEELSYALGGVLLGNASVDATLVVSPVIVSAFMKGCIFAGRELADGEVVIAPGRVVVVPSRVILRQYSRDVKLNVSAIVKDAQTANCFPLVSQVALVWIVDHSSVRPGRSSREEAVVMLDAARSPRDAQMIDGAVVDALSAGEKVAGNDFCFAGKRDWSVRGGANSVVISASGPDTPTFLAHEQGVRVAGVLKCFPLATRFLCEIVNVGVDMATGGSVGDFLRRLEERGQAQRAKIDGYVRNDWPSLERWRDLMEREFTEEEVRMDARQPIVESSFSPKTGTMPLTRYLSLLSADVPGDDPDGSPDQRVVRYCSGEIQDALCEGWLKSARGMRTSGRDRSSPRAGRSGGSAADRLHGVRSAVDAALAQIRLKSGLCAEGDLEHAGPLMAFVADYLGVSEFSKAEMERWLRQKLRLCHCAGHGEDGFRRMADGLRLSLQASIVAVGGAGG
jgi:hypothetical protein